MSVDRSKAQEYYPSFSSLHRVPANTTSFLLNDLEKFSLYEVSMWTEGLNSGKSLPTYKVKVVTHIEGERQAESQGTPPALPNTKACCAAKNVTRYE